MNIKMAINSQLKMAINSQAEQKQNHRYIDHMESYQLVGGEGRRRMGEKVQGLRNTNW